MKLKHRLTATILLIAFATTSALPAATIPHLKNPPKAVPAPRAPVAPKAVNIPTPPKVPVIKVPAAPKIPVVPRVVSVPKVPAVKVPVTPRIVSTPKVPVVKVPVAPRMPSIKTPAVPVVAKVPSATTAARQPKAATSPKTPAPTLKHVEAPAKSKAPQLTTVATVQRKAVAEVNVVRQIIRDVQQENTKAPETGAEPEIPIKGNFPSRSNPLDRPSIKGSDENSLVETIFGVKTGKGGSAKGIFDGLLPERETPQLTPIETKKEFDQEFGRKRDSAEVAAAAEIAGVGSKGRNPVTQLSSGTGAGDGLANAGPGYQNGPMGISQQGIGAVSDAGSDAIAAVGTHSAAVSGGAALLDVVTGGATATATAIAQQAATLTAAAPTLAATTTVAGTVTPVTTTAAGAGTFTFVETAAAAASATTAGSVAAVAGALAAGIGVGVAVDKATDMAVKAVAGLVGSDAQDKVDVAVKIKDGLFGTPDPENQTTPRFGLYDLNPGILQHIGQASSGLKGSKGGSGDVTPVNEGITGGTPAGAPAGTVIVDKKNGLIGNPVRGGIREGGTGAGGPNFNGAAGQINVGPDGVVHQDGAGREIDPLAGMGNGASQPPANLGGSRSASSNNNDEDEDDSASNSSRSTTTPPQATAKKEK